MKFQFHRVTDLMFALRRNNTVSSLAKSTILQSILLPFSPPHMRGGHVMRFYSTWDPHAGNQFHRSHITRVLKTMNFSGGHYV
jgi:hypothetical protein